MDTTLELCQAPAMTRSQATEEIFDTQTSANTTCKSDRQTNRVKELFVPGELKSDTRIVFRTNSTPYFNNLIPEQYRSNLDCGSANPMFIIELKDRCYIAYGIKPTPQAIILDINVLEKISCLWWMIIPTLAGFPELVTSVNRAPATLLPALKQIIQNCGHMSYYSLDDTDRLEDGSDNSETDDDILDDSPPPPTIVCILENDYLKPTISISRVMQYLKSDKDGEVEGPWLPQERDNAITRFLTEVIRWTNAPHDPYDGRKFGREEMKENLSLLSNELKWFNHREKKREMEDRVRERGVRALRRRGRAAEYGSAGKEENTEGGREYGGRKRIRREEENTEGAREYGGRKRIRREEDHGREGRITEWSNRS